MRGKKKIILKAAVSALILLSGVSIHAASEKKNLPVSAPAVVSDAAIAFFQQVLSPQDGPVCRFRPTCSAYGREAFRRHGFLKGLLMTTDRLVRDNPFNPPSVDPVPSSEEHRH